MLKLYNLEVSYGEAQVLFGVSLEVKKGEIIALVGTNGAGKSTTLRALSRLVTLKSGTINFLGQRIDLMQPYDIVRLGIAHVPEGRQIFAEMSVADNLEVAAASVANRKLRVERKAYVYDLFPRLKERNTQLAGSLSGGEQQMLAIGRALMLSPKLLLLDEPSMGLAPKVVEEVMDLLVKLNSEGLTVLLVEQNVDLALSIAHRGYVLETGIVRMSGSGKDLLQDDSVRMAYMGL